VHLLRRIILNAAFISLACAPCFASQITVDETLALADLVTNSSHIFVVEHAPPKRPLVSNVSVVHLRILKTLKGSQANRNEVLQVIHFQEDLLEKFRRSQQSVPKKSLLVRGYKPPMALEEALKKRFIVFLSLRNARFHFVAPGAYEGMDKMKAIQSLTKKGAANR
jgi:hypothetical protein